ncbi:MAG TPA: SDR family NAD(P)-dependent oxidoreductase, partial [Haliangium sp.]|nr:SDR family NAD(P)-dependent oxidoreductase [Haliangium sp.]
MNIHYDFSERVAFIIGGTSGIGLATASAFARAGARIAIAARQEARGREACELLERAGAEVLFVRADVSDEESVAQAVRDTVARFGRLD